MDVYMQSLEREVRSAINSIHDELMARERKDPLLSSRQRLERHSIVRQERTTAFGFVLSPNSRRTQGRRREEDRRAVAGKGSNR